MGARPGWPGQASWKVRSFSEQFWTVVDDSLDKTMSEFGVPKRYRGTIKDVHKRRSRAEGRDQGAVRAAAQTKFWELGASARLSRVTPAAVSS
jgi:hypothetical protein